MTPRLHKLAALSAVLAAGTFAPPALALHQAAGKAEPARVHQDLRSPDARDAALHPRYLQRWTVMQPPTWPVDPQPLVPPAPHPAASGSGGDGLDTAPLAAGIAALAAAFGVGVSLRRRQARSVA
jgi:hypothetical protein